MGINKIIYIVGITLICSLSGVVYFQYDSINSLNKEIQSLELTVEMHKVYEDELRGEVESIKFVNKELQNVNQGIKAQLDTIKTHDLDNIAIKKPKLLERRVNNATDKIWNDIACHSDIDRVCND